MLSEEWARRGGSFVRQAQIILTRGFTGAKLGCHIPNTSGHNCLATRCMPELIASLSAAQPANTERGSHASDS